MGSGSGAGLGEGMLCVVEVAKWIVLSFVVVEASMESKWCVDGGVCCRFCTSLPDAETTLRYVAEVFAIAPDDR